MKGACVVVTSSILRCEEEFLRLVSLFCLSESEIHRFEEIIGLTEKAEFVSGRVLARLSLSQILGVEPRNIPINIGCGGRPCLAGEDLDFNLSHGGGFVVVALCSTAKVGVDVQDCSLVKSDRVLLQYLGRKFRCGDRSPEIIERMIVDRWCMSEAFAKCSGLDFLFSMKSHDFLSIIERTPKFGWFTGDRHSVYLSSIADGRVPVALCVLGQPMPVTFQEVDLASICTELYTNLLHD